MGTDKRRLLGRDSNVYVIYHFTKLKVFINLLVKKEKKN